MTGSGQGKGPKQIGDLVGPLLRGLSHEREASDQPANAGRAGAGEGAAQGRLPLAGNAGPRRASAGDRQMAKLDALSEILTTPTQDRDALRFMARVLIQATFPHSQAEGFSWERTNGSLSVSMVANPAAGGLPYGSYPRLLMAWITTEAVSNKQRKSGADMRRLELGHSLSGFMAELGLLPTGGRWGTIGRLKDQMDRLFSTAIFTRELMDDPQTGHRGRRAPNLLIAEDSELWWDPQKPAQGVLWGSWVDLSERFFDLITERPVPVDMDVLRYLKKSPLALDIYCWATYRVSYLSTHTLVPWEGLMMQLGAGYPDTPQGRRDFKKKFIEALKKVGQAWPGLRAEVETAGLRLRPCSPQVARRPKLLPPK